MINGVNGIDPFRGRMSRFRQLFGTNSPYIMGMIHVGALPGTPNSHSSLKYIIEEACRETEIYKSYEVDAVLIENMHDVPYVQSSLIGPEIVASMTRVCTEIRKILPRNIKCGVQVLAGANKEALAIALASNLQFIRAEGYIFGHVADEGMMNSCAGELLRYRRSIGGKEIQIYTDIKKKHCAHSITADVTIEETAKAAEFFLSDGLILTGSSTGDPANIEELKRVKQSTTLPVIIGSGVTADNISNYISADAIIIGSYFKRDGRWQNEVDERRVETLMACLRKCKQTSVTKRVVF